MTATRVLLVDDDQALCELLAEYLQSHGFDVTAMHSGQSVLDITNIEQMFDILCLDIMMPGMSGLELLPAVRAQSSVPIIMVTGRGDDIDRVIGLEMGADDYIAKPCNPRELVARIRAVLRRANLDKNPMHTCSEALVPNESLHFNGLALFPKKREVCLKGQVLQLTGAEFDILAILMQQQGQIVSKAKLTEQVLHRKLTRYDRSIDVHVSRVRQKLSEQCPEVEWIKTVRGAGYIFVATQEGINGQ